MCGACFIVFIFFSVVTIAHKSGGPQSDIVVPYKGQSTGFLANSVDSYCDALQKVLSLDPKKRLPVAELQKIRQAARAHVAAAFSQEIFEEQIRNIWCTQFQKWSSTMNLNKSQGR